MAPKKDPKKQVVEEPVIQEPVIPPHELKGIGRFDYPSGAFYEGEWHLFNGIKMKHGEGTLTIVSQGSHALGGEQYQGTWAEDRMNGKGIYRYANGAVYDGQFRNNQQNGLGKYEFPNATIYEGEWQAGLMHGTGFYIDTNGRNWQGEFRQGKFQTRLQEELGKEKVIVIRKQAVKRQIIATLNSMLEALAKSDKKTLKDNMAPFFVAGQAMKEFVKDPYSKVDERPQQKWVQVVNIIKTGKVKVLMEPSDSQLLGAEKVLGKQLEGAGQVVQIIGSKDERTTKVALASPDGTVWNVVLVQDEEKKK